MIKRDDRYDTIKPMVDSGAIVSFNQCFKYIPKTIVAKDLGKKVDRFNTLMNKVEEFTLEDLFIIASFFKITEDQILDLIMYDYRKGKSGIVSSVI